MPLEGKSQYEVDRMFDEKNRNNKIESLDDTITSSNSAAVFCLFCLILYVPSTIFQLYKDGSSLVETVLFLLKDKTQ